MKKRKCNYHALHSHSSNHVESFCTAMAARNPGLIALFDVDGTLTAPRKNAIVNDIKFAYFNDRWLLQLCWSSCRNFERQVVTMGVVGGSDLVKISEQLGSSVINDYDYIFAENGLVAHKDGKLIGTEVLLRSNSFLPIRSQLKNLEGYGSFKPFLHSSTFLFSVFGLLIVYCFLNGFSLQSLKLYLGEDKLKEFINFTLHYIADLDIPIKRGTFIEFRSGMLNVSPIGRNCSQEERDEFEKYDKVQNICPKMVSVLREKFSHLNLTFSIGGQIILMQPVFPQGWDKTYCLGYLDDFREIHFFGDKTYKGGNDFEIHESERTLGHTDGLNVSLEKLPARGYNEAMYSTLSDQASLMSSKVISTLFPLASIHL
ncbi:hypothetical protein RHSIM_RhsimUnG0002300 [Rhododendron simsii]|uniref:Phosphomannomutase n=1 Tax=Rhododendron simsii TaxID=118357 RepID=A0A834FX74_RHOSS|nr:hypothetical protein RHSIM_RhsimUnG0002300 [Rhododendron simsii]